MLLVNDPGDWGHVYAPLEHAPWHGCTPTDLVFPFFLFVVGVSTALALLPRLEQGVAPGALVKAALWRALRILALGVAINLLAAWLLPHAHLRGSAAKFTAHYPDGREEILLSVPKYDFNWQPLYVLEPSKFIPAGTRIVMDMTWDNSAQNPANPDPDRIVRWGDQTWEEMDVGWFRYRAADDDDRRAARAVPAKQASIGTRRPGN